MWNHISSGSKIKLLRLKLWVRLHWIKEPRVYKAPVLYRRFKTRDLLKGKFQWHPRVSPEPYCIPLYSQKSHCKSFFPLKILQHIFPPCKTNKPKERRYFPLYKLHGWKRAEFYSVQVRFVYWTSRKFELEPLTSRAGYNTLYFIFF